MAHFGVAQERTPESHIHEQAGGGTVPGGGTRILRQGGIRAWLPLGLLEALDELVAPFSRNALDGLPLQPTKRVAFFLVDIWAGSRRAGFSKITRTSGGPNTQCLGKPFGIQGNRWEAQGRNPSTVLREREKE